MTAIRYRLVLVGDEHAPDTAVPLWESEGEVLMWGDYAPYHLGSDKPLGAMTREDLPDPYPWAPVAIHITPVSLARDFDAMRQAAVVAVRSHERAAA
jgi:hypothetical protein